MTDQNRELNRSGSLRAVDLDRRAAMMRALALAGSAAGLGFFPQAASAEPPPETTRLRLMYSSAICIAPMFLAEELLAAEGFTDVQYRKDELGLDPLAAGQADISMNSVYSIISHLDVGDPLIVLGGVHLGCYELFGTGAIRSIRDLKGKNIAVRGMNVSEHILLASMLAYVGLDPNKDVRWSEHPPAESMRLLAQGKVDAFMGFPPEPQELRNRNIGHLVVDTSADRPWSQYYCCMAVGHRDFVRKYPVATKRALRAILKSADLCAQQPERAARFIVDKGYVSQYDYAVQALKEVPYNSWRTYDPTNTLRFFALRLHEVGMIKATPQKIVEQGTDWRFLNELKRELKA
jgi:NitT/TauT family transport system substrate-binding protein